MMSLAKKFAIAAMAIIFVVICAIVMVGNKTEYDINEKLEEAKGYFEMMDYDKTIATYNSIISKDKTCVDAYLGLASAYSEKGNETKAFEILEQGLDATRNHTRIAKKIEEMTAANEAEEAAAETTVTETVTDVPVTEITIVTEPVVTEVTSVTTSATVTTPATSATTSAAASETTAATTAVASKTTIVTTVKPTIPVPDFIGISKEEASRLAESRNIRLAFKYENNDAYPNGFIYYQSNRAGTLVASGAAVYAYVCVNDIEYVSEETKALRNLSSNLEAMADSVSGSISTDEENSVITINVNSTKRFVLDEKAVKAMLDCDSATVLIVTDDFTLTIPTTSVCDVDFLDLSSDYSGNYKRAMFTIAEGAESCDVKVTLTNCTINTTDYEEMLLYTNNKNPAEIELTIDEEPVFFADKSGTYTIK